MLPYIGGVRFKEVVQGREQGSETQLFHKDDTRRAMEWLLTQSRTNDWLTPAALNSKFEDPVTEWREKVDKAIVATLLSPVNIGRIKTGYEADPTKGYEPATYVDDALKNIFAATYSGKETQFHGTQATESSALESMVKSAGCRCLGASAKALLQNPGRCRAFFDSWTDHISPLLARCLRRS